MPPAVSTDLRRCYREDGAIHLSQALDQATLAEVERMFQWSLDNPTPSGCTFYDNESGTFYQDLCNPRAALAYRTLLTDSCIADRVADLWGDEEVWFLYEQVFYKHGGDTRRTPWHQDAPYLAVDGEHIAVVWINLESVQQQHALEFVRGSHRGVLYDGSAFDDDDDTKPIYGSGLPRLPNIEADRSQWDIVSWAIEPGDIVVFHPRTLHGGGPTTQGMRRRTLSLRFFGADAAYVERPTDAPAPLVAGLHDSLRAGQPFRHPAFPQLRPVARGFEQVPVIDGHVQSVRAKLQGG